MPNASSPPFTLRGIEHVLLLVRDLESSLAFYQDVLGATLQSRLPQYGMAELRAGDSHIDLVDVSAPEGSWAVPPISGGRNVDHVGLRISSTDEAALRAHLSEFGVEIVEERYEESERGRHLSLYVRDPCGNVIELMT